ncbi:aldo/keto reductase [Niabella insulamsoli]|uniref:aldo/keto reductase n=1 Tax=Niabella insulamsoli TaxID=3144874 RepID=UPI0031FDAC98
MNYRNFRGTGIAEIGLGTWQLGSVDWGAVDEAAAFNILRAYTDAGGNFVDTADVYGMGISESVIGKFLNAVDKDIFVATKLGRRQDTPGGWQQHFSYDTMKRHLEDSLKNLNVNSLFLEQLHCIPTEAMREGSVFKQLRKFQEQGLIQHWGASVETVEEALICLDQEGLASLQIIFNIFRQHIAEEFFSKAKEKNVAIIVRVPLASGLLTGKFSVETVFPEQDHRNYNADGSAFNAGETFSGIPFDKGIAFANQIQQHLPDKRMAPWALRWILDHPEVTTVIPGASKVAHVQSNVSASGLPPLSAAIHQQLKAIYDDQIRATIRGHY